MKKVSIIIPIYNALDEVKLLLKSICDNLNFELSEVILVNDFSNNDTSDYLKDFVIKNKNFILLNNDKNLGFVKTCNKGMNVAKGDIIVLLNSDTLIPKEFAERIIKCFDSDKNIGVASPVRTFGGQFAIKMPKDWSLEQANQYLRKKHKCIYPRIPSAEGCCFCIRKTVLEKQGYLDEVYGKGYHEEVDFAYRANTNGWKNVLIDDLYIYHKMHASFGTEFRKKLIEQNNIIFYERWSDFYSNFVQKYNYKNPVEKIENELFPMRKIFSISDSREKTHKIITIFGLRIKFRKSKRN